MRNPNRYPVLPPVARAAVVVAAALTVGCFGTPNQANIDLRKRIQSLEEQAKTLEQRHRADTAEVRALRSQSPGLTTLPQDRLDRLYTVRGIQFGRLTGGADLDRDKPGDEGVKIYVVPTDADGQPLKAAGSFTFDLFDLAEPQSPQLGHWTFDAPQAKGNWHGAFLDYTYAFTLPWQHVPRHSDLTVKVSFLDELTQLKFDAQSLLKITLPLAGGPETRPAR